MNNEFLDFGRNPKTCKYCREKTLTLPFVRSLKHYVTEVIQSKFKSCLLHTKHTHTPLHLIELIDDSPGYVTHTGKRRNKRRGGDESLVCFLREDRTAEAAEESRSGHTQRIKLLGHFSYSVASAKMCLFTCESDDKAEKVAAVICVRCRLE